jgi:hypothetical protein
MGRFLWSRPIGFRPYQRGISRFRSRELIHSSRGTLMDMRLRELAAALLLISALIVACQPAGGGGGTESTTPSMAPHSDIPEASATPYTAPGY